MVDLYDSAKKIVNTFSKACAVNCGILDIQKTDGFQERLETPFCAVCCKEQLKRYKTLKCEDMHKLSAHQSERWGGKYEYLCPAGLAFVCTTLSKGTDIRYCIYAGPFLMVNPEEFIHEDLENLFLGAAPRKLASEAKRLAYIGSSRVSSLADILLALALLAEERSSLELQIIEQSAQTDSQVFYSLYGIKTSETAMYRYPIQQEKLLQGYIAQGDKASAQKVLNDILGHIFFCSGGNFEVIKARITELIVLLSRAAIEGGADVSEVFGLNYNYLNDIHGFKNLDELNIWLSKVLIRFTNIVFDISLVKHSEVIKKIIQFIRSNYMKKITLNDISDSVNFSVSYVCKIFKDEMSTSLSSFINRTRVENSKILLLNNDIPLVDVSYLCGFDDQSYFSKVFKKATGVTPGLFREKRGKI